MLPDRGPDSVGADQRQRQLLLTRRAAALDHGQPPGMADDVFELAAEPQFDIGVVVDLGLQRGLQVGAVHHPIGGTGAGCRPLRRAAGGQFHRRFARS